MTTTNNDEFETVLNGLIQICIDGQMGFELVANGIESPSLKAELLSFSQQRGMFAAELQGLVAFAGDTPKESGSVSGAVHRGWINLREVLSSRDTYATLAECERGEDHAVAAYRKATSSSLPPKIEPIVRRQHATVQSTHDRVKALRDAAKASV